MSAPEAARDPAVRGTNPGVPADWTTETRSPEGTARLAAALAGVLQGGEIILLRGELGAGKTCFAQGLASGLGIAEPVVSPTFVLQRSYSSPGGLALHHFDFYRLSGAADLDALGIEEFATEEGVVLVEWPERCPEVFPDFTVEIRLTVIGDDARRIEGRWGSLAGERARWIEAIDAADGSE
jgi:tRNA threonylcarbamoyladenosine biosynthesis protein TsaE